MSTEKEIKEEGKTYPTALAWGIKKIEELKNAGLEINADTLPKLFNEERPHIQHTSQKPCACGNRDRKPLKDLEIYKG